MNKFSNSAMLLDIENFMKQQIADKIKTCPSRIKILSIGCIYQQWSQPVDGNGFAIDEDDDDEYEDDYEDEDDFDFGDEVIYEVKCPVCNAVINLDEEMLEAGSIECPDCGEELEFDADDVEEE